MGIRFGAEPAIIARGIKDGRHAVMNLLNQRVGRYRYDGKRPLPLSSVRIAPVLPQSCQTEWRAIRHGNRVGLLGPSTFDGAPLEKTIDWHDAAALSVSVTEHRAPGDALSLGVNGLASTSRVLAPMGNQPPLDQVERALACLMVFTNDQQLLAWRTVVAGPNVPQPAVADLEAVDDGETEGTGALDYTAAHSGRATRKKGAHEPG